MIFAHFFFKITLIINMLLSFQGYKMADTPKKTRDTARIEREAAALRKNLEKRKKQIEARERLKRQKSEEKKD